MKECMICPRCCGARRNQNETGFCGETNDVRVAKTSLHRWEEPCITGKDGSGTVFFTGCNLKCIFCQNHTIAGNSVGKVVTVNELADLFIRLQNHGATNINLVTAGHFIVQVREALQIAKKRGLVLPVVYNSSAYETVEALKLLDGLVDIYLPDCKFMNPVISKNYASAENYFEVAKKAIDEMVRQAGDPQFEESEWGTVMKKGVIVRHLILPGHTKDSMNIVRYLYQTYGDRICLSIMNQFTPVVKQEKYLNLNRRLTKREYSKVVDFAIGLGVENAYIQEGDVAKESFIPDFDVSFV